MALSPAPSLHRFLSVTAKKEEARSTGERTQTFFLTKTFLPSQVSNLGYKSILFQKQEIFKKKHRNGFP